MMVAGIIGVISLIVLAFIIGWKLSGSRSTNIYPDPNETTQIPPLQSTGIRGSYDSSIRNLPPPPLPGQSRGAIGTIGSIPTPGNLSTGSPLTGRTASGLPRSSSIRRITIYDFPKCPTCRKRNLVGKPQEVYWSSQRKMYYCKGKHYFTGKE